MLFFVKELHECNHLRKCWECGSHAYNYLSHTPLCNSLIVEEWTGCGERKVGGEIYGSCIMCTLIFVLNFNFQSNERTQFLKMLQPQHLWHSSFSRVPTVCSKLLYRCHQALNIQYGVKWYYKPGGSFEIICKQMRYYFGCFDRLMTSWNGPHVSTCLPAT